MDKENKKEWRQDACKTAINVYLVLMLLVQPLYMTDGYRMIGDAKYQFFRNITVFFLVVIALLCLAGVSWRRFPQYRLTFSATDIAVACYLGSAVCAWIFSVDRQMAWSGFPGWHMGLLSQILFAWVYFATSRLYDGSAGVLRGFLAGAILVMALGILNCYNFDPLRMFQELGDWQREHLRSTIGNSNWYCGYLSIASSIGICYGCIGKKWERAAGLFASLLLFWAALTSCSEGAYLFLVAQMGVLLLWALDSRKQMSDFLSIILCAPMAAFAGRYCIRFRGLMLAEDGVLIGFLFWEGFGALFVLLAVLLAFLCIREKRGCGDWLRRRQIGRMGWIFFGILLCICLAVLAACQFSDAVWKFFGEWELLRITDSWGSDRGALWRMSLGSFRQTGFLRKFFGAGSDCFSHVIYQYYPVNEMIGASGQWAGAVYANAHNEWLNLLLNQGIIGLSAYIGIFATLFVRLWRHRKAQPLALLGLLAIAGYAAYALVSFQQAASTPLLFAVLGISESFLKNSLR